MEHFALVETMAEIKPMDATRLEEVARFLFPDAGRTWKTKIAEAMGIHPTTVRRWVMGNEVPPGYDRALECLAARKLDLMKQNG